MRFILKPIITYLLAVTLLVHLVSCTSIGGDEKETERITIRLAAPQNPYIQDFDTNLYKLWLEEQTGLNIEMKWLPRENAEAIARSQLQSGIDMADAYVGFGSYDMFSDTNIRSYGESGTIIALDSLIESSGTHIKALWEELPEYNIERYMTSSDGNIYFMPGFSSSTITRFRQLLWVNEGWLDELNIEVPETLDEFTDMLRAFRDNYPGCIPMAGTEDFYSKQPYDFLFNAFIYNDVRNYRLLPEDGIIDFAPIREQWRDALIYMRGLYDEGLYSPLSFTQDDQQFNQMANDPLDVLGVFMSPGITYTVLQNSPEIMSRYTGIPPLRGPQGVQLASVYVPIPRANGVLTSACEHPEEAFKLFDLMLSVDACLMGRYGEFEVDWEFAQEGEISIYETPATIRIINQLWNTPQNKHLAQIVPYVSRPQFSGGVTWNGDPTDGEYINAGNAKLSVDYEPGEFIGFIIYSPDEDAQIGKIRSDIEAYVNASIVDFITGARDIYDDSVWQKYVRELYDLGLDEFLRISQQAYDRVEG